MLWFIDWEYHCVPNERNKQAPYVMVRECTPSHSERGHKLCGTFPSKSLLICYPAKSISPSILSAQAPLPSFLSIFYAVWISQAIKPISFIAAISLLSWRMFLALIFPFYISVSYSMTLLVPLTLPFLSGVCNWEETKFCAAFSPQLRRQYLGWKNEICCN